MGNPGRIDSIMQRAAALAPGFLYSLNIADLKRRNSHLGHRVGDADIAELHRVLQSIASADIVVERTAGDKWHVFSGRDITARIGGILEGYRKAEKFSAGWKISAVLNGHEKVRRHAIPAEMRRAVRCLYTEVTGATDVAAAIDRLAASDYSLPVNRPLRLADVPNLPRKPWRSVSEYPAEDPSCPYCGGRDFVWEDGDDSVYSGDGKCSCGAQISISDVSADGG
jgi:hypothetical protein